MQLFINTRGTLLRRTGERVLIERDGIKHEFAAQKIHSIVIATGVRITSDLIQLATENHVDIVFLDKRGDPTSRVWQTRMGSTVTIRRRQLEACQTTLGIGVAAEWIVKKLQNQIDFLKELQSRRRNEDRLARSVVQIHECRQKVETLVESLHEKVPADWQVAQSDIKQMQSSLLGLEGTAGRIYFAAIGGLMPADYKFSGRSRRPATDGFNAMLNYGYGVLYSIVERSLILAGLDPFIGFFHCDSYNKPSLIYDLIEPFRVIAERTTVLYFTGRRVKKDFFRDVPGGTELAPAGRAALIESLNQRLDKAVRYPVQKANTSKPGPAKHRNIKLRDTIRHEAHSIANRLLGKTDIPQVVQSSDLFNEET